MNKFFIIGIGFSLLIIFGFSQQDSKTRDLNPKIDVKISIDCDLTEGKPIMINCKITNPTDSIQKIEFTEHHPYHKKLPYATCIWASIMDMGNNSLCKYGTQYVLWSTTFESKNNEYITLKPGDKITRKLNICQIAFDCSCEYAEGLKKGKYRIQLFVHSAHSNVLEIEIR